MEREEDKNYEAREKITNRQIGKLLSTLEEAWSNIPEIAKDTIRKHLWYISEDLAEIYCKGVRKDGHKNE